MAVVEFNVAEIWQVAADRLQQQIHVTTYEQWFQNIVPVSLDKNALNPSVPRHHSTKKETDSLLPFFGPHQIFIPAT